MPSILTTLAQGSAPFISTFLLVHLSAPIMANLGGASLASQAMILGREYYQTSFGHRFLVVIPILTHGLSATAKRIMGNSRSRPLRNAFSIAGYATMFFLLPQHYLLHHILPSNPNPPILAVSPSELDHEYVKFGLQKWPLINWCLYAGLTIAVVWHATEGSRIMWNTWLAGKAGVWKKNAGRHVATVIAGVLPVLTGLFAISREPLMIFASTAERYDAAFRQHFFFRL
ncbi:hypothetical protein BDY19DRAFT_919134 [Irpex rosettiformis]|uniref:Uncharacterized protein n=1 Tax=Irpex rosettiformis TaxID=378272 RepID=A0ACB8UHH3_9APHY|nr:hypothetical protein BDY19DRAFT_919134 [Irpex rosettiformis]